MAIAAPAFIMPTIPALSTPVPGDNFENTTENVNVTFRLLLPGADVGSIIGKKGDTIRLYREASGAKINISDNYGANAQRVITIIGTAGVCLKACTLIVGKVEEDAKKLVPPAPVIIRLLLPETQCTAIVGKDGAKLKEIIELSGADVQVAGNTILHPAADRVISVAGESQQICQAIWQFAIILVESAPRAARIAAAAAAKVQPLLQQACNIPMEDSKAKGPPTLATLLAQTHIPTGDPLPVEPDLYAGPGAIYEMNHENIAKAAKQAANTPVPPPQYGVDIVIPDELAGLIIGRGGHRINEVRKSSGAQIKISDQTGVDRTVTISGSKQAVDIAQFLINTKCLGFTY